jgi:glycosyltransferase involved in cell wall biosynthesis
LAGELEKAGIECRILDKSPGWNLRILPKLRALFREWHPDIVHTFRFTANTSGRIGAVMARVPVVIGTEHVLEHKDACRRIVDWILARFTDRMVVVTQEIADQVHSQHCLPRSRIQLIEEGIDLDRFCWVERETPLVEATMAARAFKAGIVARLAPQKGHQVFLEAIRRARETRPVVKGIIVGDGQLRPELEQWVADHRMQDGIEFWGFREDLPVVFRQLDLFVMTSGWEGLPLALLDAAATGLPFVCTAVGGIQEVFQDGVHGRLVSPDNPTEIADAIVWSLDNYAAACSMAKTASALVHERHELKAMIRRHEEMYLQLTRT